MNLDIRSKVWIYPFLLLLIIILNPMNVYGDECPEASMRNKIFIPITFFFILISCTSEKTKTHLSLESSQSWDVIEGIMLKDWDKEKIESIIGKPKKLVGDNTSLYFDEDTKLQKFAIEYNPSQRASAFSFSPQEYEAPKFFITSERKFYL